MGHAGKKLSACLIYQDSFMFYFLYQLVRRFLRRICESSSNCEYTVLFLMADCVSVQVGKWKRKAFVDDKSEAISWCRTFNGIHYSDFGVILLLKFLPLNESHKLDWIGSIFISTLRQFFEKNNKANFYRGVSRNKIGVPVSKAIILLIQARLVN